MTDNEKLAIEVMGWEKGIGVSGKDHYFDGSQPIMPCSDFAPNAKIEQAMMLREAVRVKKGILLELSYSVVEGKENCRAWDTLDLIRSDRIAEPICEVYAPTPQEAITQAVLEVIKEGEDGDKTL